MLVARFMDIVDKKDPLVISEKSYFGSASEKALTINCMGFISLTQGEVCQRDICALKKDIENNTISFAVAFDSDNVTKRLLENNGVSLLCENSPFSSQIFRTNVGSIGVISYDRAPSNQSDTQEQIMVMRHILALKHRSADYIMIYVNNDINDNTSNTDTIYFYKLLSQMGVDYIVGLLPSHRDGGTTYLKPDGGIARSIYSLGTFLSDKKEISPKRVMVRLKMEVIKGKLQLFEESYVPYYYTQADGLVSLLTHKDGSPFNKQEIRYRAELYDEMNRIRPADSILKVKDVMKQIGVELPESAQHLKDFSVGKICACSFEVMPGDLFFFREPFMDPNDLEEPNPKKRIKIAKKAVKKGAILLVTFQPLPFRCDSVLCNNVMEAHITACAYIRKQFKMKTIGITGSVGKTSTKDMLAEVMRMRYNTVKSEQNGNVQVKIGMNLQKLNDACEVYIQEIGGGRPGGASRHSRMILPQVAVVTNIGDAHIGNFASKEKLMKNKLAIEEGLSDDGILFLNADDPLLVKAHCSHKTVFFAVHNKNADYYAQNLSTHGGSCSFNIVHNGKCTPVTLNVSGEYNVLNAVCCFAIGKQFDIPDELIAEGLSHFTTTGIRQNLIKVCGRKLFVDCYNASTESIKSAMEILAQIQIEPNKKRIAVIGDITGMGELSESVHKEIGYIIREYNVDHVLLFGEDVKYTYEILKNAGMSVSLFTKREELNQKIQSLVDIGDVALFKSSSKMLLEYTIDMVYGTRLTDQRLQDEREYKAVRKGPVIYNLFANYATAEEYAPLRSGERRIQIAGKVGGIEVVNMGRALQGRNIENVILPDSIRHISAEAFMDCTQLTTLRIPKKLKYIGKGAFKNCRSLQEIKLPETLIHIGSRAFLGCSGLGSITIPPSVVQIGKDAFFGCENCQFFYQKGSYAEKYLLEEGIVPQAQ